MEKFILTLIQNIISFEFCHKIRAHTIASNLYLFILFAMSG